MTSMRSCRMNCPVKTNIHPSIHTIMETTLSKDVQEKLDMINWDSLKDKYGISRETFYNNPHLASQLAYGQMTDLVFASKEDFSGLLSLRANMDTSGEKPEMKVKAFTMEKLNILPKERRAVYELCVRDPQEMDGYRKIEILDKRTALSMIRQNNLPLVYSGEDGLIWESAPLLPCPISHYNMAPLFSLLRKAVESMT